VTIGPRVRATKIVCQVTSGSSLSDALAAGLEQTPPQERALVQELCYGVLRWWLRLEWIANSLLERPLKRRDRDLEALILVGIYQLLYMRIPTHAVVAETVEGARELDKPWAAGLINGVLRNLIRNQEDLLAAIGEDVAADLSFPEWLLGMIRKAWPDDWRSILEAANARPPMALRVNRKLSTREEYAGKLQKAGIAARPVPGVASGLLLDQPQDVLGLPGFSEGLVSVQDGGAQLAAGLLELQPGDRVLDLCAAPGGKACHILELAPDDVTMTAVDIHQERLLRVGENLQRLGLSASLYAGDAAEPEGTWADTGYERILLDVPCSATGVIRRHPDIKMLRRPEDIGRLAELQQSILESAWNLLQPGGLLLYATCSLLPRENEKQVENFLSRHADAVELPIDAAWGHGRSHGRQTLPGEDSMDGFYYARIKKRQATA
jgi:16S rRNA (cytosine967-C5)-methyltransferase